MEPPLNSNIIEVYPLLYVNYAIVFLESIKAARVHFAYD